MKLVILESPWQDGTDKNRRYLALCIADCLIRGESPYASHAILPLALSDSDPVKRQMGIEAGFAWRWAAEKTVVYRDLGITTGMKAGIEHATLSGSEIEYREIGA